MRSGRAVALQIRGASCWAARWTLKRDVCPPAKDFWIDAGTVLHQYPRQLHTFRQPIDTEVAQNQIACSCLSSRLTTNQEFIK
jgi:hypothetical protein